MRVRSRFRRAVKWGGLVCCSLLAAAWTLSLFWSVCWWIKGASCTLVLVDGALYRGLFPPDSGITWSISPTGRVDICRWPELHFWPRFGGIPLWIPFVIIAVPTGLAWRAARRRIRPGCCRECGYDLTGNVSGVCPECATPARDAPDARAGR
jgi:hypothetical protein